MTKPAQKEIQAHLPESYSIVINETTWDRLIMERKAGMNALVVRDVLTRLLQHVIPSEMRNEIRFIFAESTQKFPYEEDGGFSRFASWVALTKPITENQSIKRNGELPNSKNSYRLTQIEGDGGNRKFTLTQATPENAYNPESDKFLPSPFTFG